MQRRSSAAPPIPPVPPPVDRATETRNRILAAARESVLRNGFSGTSMVAIARAARVGRTTVYRNWTDLQSLLADVLTIELMGVLADLKPVEDSSDSLDEVAAVIVWVANELRRSQIVQALIEHETELMSTYVFKRFGTAQSGMIDEIRRRLTHAAIKDPRLGPRSIDQVSIMTIYIVQGALLSSKLGEDVVDGQSWRTELSYAVRGHLGVPLSYD